MAVELGNAWREAQVAEREEIDRILDELSALVAANAVALRETLSALARIWHRPVNLATQSDGKKMLLKYDGKEHSSRADAP